MRTTSIKVGDRVAFSREFLYERIAFDELPSGYRVSTVRLEQYFETMVFPPGSWLDVACERTRSETLARHNHLMLVAQFEREADQC